MTPAARVSAAIEILDTVLAGQAAEKTLTTWARRNRYAGSGDRAAIRDHVFDALRCLRSYGYLGGSQTGRGIMIGAMRAQAQDPDTLFDGSRFAPAPLDQAERAFPDLSTAPKPVQFDQQDWLLDHFAESLGDTAEPVMQALRHRAPVFLRVNLAISTVARAMDVLADEGIETIPHTLSQSALRVTANPRRVQSSRAFHRGLVELQDAASQAAVDFLPIKDGMRILDYCAGGGGKSLAMAARGSVEIFAHDIDPARMADIPVRAERAKVKITCLSGNDLSRHAPFDLVLIDAPCSGSGAWRRSPEAKWRLSPERLAELVQIQSDLLDRTTEYLTANGVLAYATCSLFRAENHSQIANFIARDPAWTVAQEKQLSPLDGGDGFFIACLTR